MLAGLFSLKVSRRDSHPVPPSMTSTTETLFPIRSHSQVWDWDFSISFRGTQTNPLQFSFERNYWNTLWEMLPTRILNFEQCSFLVKPSRCIIYTFYFFSLVTEQFEVWYRIVGAIECQRLFSCEDDFGFRMVDLKPFFLTWTSLPDRLSAGTTPTANSNQLSSAERRVLACVSSTVGRLAASMAKKNVTSHSAAHLNEQMLKYTSVSQPLKPLLGLEVSMNWKAEWPSIKIESGLEPRLLF